MAVSFFEIKITSKRSSLMESCGKEKSWGKLRDPRPKLKNVHKTNTFPREHQKQTINKIIRNTHRFNALLLCICEIPLQFSPF